MQVIDKSSEGLKREFNVVVGADAIEAKVVARLNEVGRQVRLPGFRPGKVPMNLLRKRFGSSVMGEVLEKTIDESTQAALSKKALKPAAQPKVEVVKFEEGKDLEFSVALEVLPEIKAADFTALELEKQVADVTDEEVEKAISNFLNNNKTTELISDDRKSKIGDVLLIDFIGRIGGEAFEGGSATGTQLELGAGRFIPGFEDQLVGAKAGDNVVVKVKFPEDYRATDLAGKDAEFEVKVRELQQYVTPELTDDLAKKMGRETADDVRKGSRELIQKEHDRVSRLKLKRELLDKLAEGHDFAVPQGMVDAEFGAIWAQIEQAKSQGQLEAEDAGKSDDELKAEYRSIAERRVRLGLLLSDVGLKNKIAVTSEELSRAIAQEASRYPGQEQMVVNYYQKNPQAIESLRAPILEEKVVDYIISQAKVSTKTVSVEELTRDPDAPAADGHVHDENCNHDHDHDHDHGGAKAKTAKKKAAAKKKA